MHVTCSRCSRASEYSGERPRFCAHCGQQHLVAEGPSEYETEAQTLTPSFDPDATLAPSLPYLGDDEVPQVVGGYKLLRRLGGGGMGSVYEAEDPASEHRVALKLILPQYAESPDAVLRFRQEGRLASSLSHPRCVFVLAADEDVGRPYIVMELMPGNTLDDLVQQSGALPLQDALAKILDVIDGLYQAHQLGLVHRDVKPSNCFLEADGRVKVGDFGLAKSLVSESKLTRTGTFMGTPLFAAPEQIKLEATDAQSDLYSVAATLYFLLTGRAPFQTGDVLATLARIVSDDPPSMRTVRPELPRALDKVVLRGLERDRKRRWRDLDEFRKALQPFLPVKPSLGGIGLRFGAYLIDSILLGIVGQILTLGIFAPAPRAGVTVQGFQMSMIYKQILTTVLWLAYMGILEGIWGWSVGKRLLRLRVGTTNGNAPPGVGRALLRSGFLYFLIYSGSLALVLVSMTGSLPVEGTRPTKDQALLLTGVGCANLLWICSAAALLVCTMRVRNGYRGLHEFISGTRTYRLGWPKAPKRQAIRRRAFPVMESSHPEGIPERVGTFRIRGALRWLERERILLGEDPQLGRGVWVWMRPGSEQPLEAGTRDVNRNTRVRWVASGKEGGWRWDAFLASSGARLPEVIAAAGPLSWAEARLVLEDLTDELVASCGDGTLPEVLNVHHVWLQPDGRVQLLDTDLTGAASGGPNEIEEGEPTGDEDRALALLRQVAVFALEGRARPLDGSRPPIRAPLPVHATPLMERLFGSTKPGSILEEFQADLIATRDRPTEVTRFRRCGHLALTVVLLHVPFLGPWLLVGAPFIALRWKGGLPPGTSEDEVAAYVAVASCTLFWVVWAFLFRGGYAYFRGGIALRRADGRKATRLQCAYRALLVWAPVGALFVLANGVAHYRPDLPVVYFGIWGFGVAALIAFAVLAIVFPTRAPHDRLAGTYLVPD